MLYCLMDKSSSMFRPFYMSSVHIIIIALIGLLCYSNTLNVPFQWDELAFIEDYPIVKDISYFLEPSKAIGPGFHQLRNRYIGFLTFALNYKANGLDVTGYHIVNISIHIINSLLVYLLVVLSFKTPFLSESVSFNKSKLMALFSALLFVSHPIQTEAVTYIFQRLASLVTMFYLLSLVCYIKFRLPDTEYSNSSSSLNRSFFTSASAYYLLSILFVVFAMKTKENAFTLPVVITMYEFFFFDGQLKKRLLRLFPILLTLLIIPLTLTGIDRPPGEIIGGMADAARGDANIERLDYMFTQFRVIVTYIRLLFLPINQNIDYDYPVFHSFFDQQVLLSFLFLFSIFCFAVYLFYRSRRTNHALRLTAFGIFWFFITISVESSVIPIPMMINEYRVYLPSASAIAGITTGIFLAFEKLKGKKSRIIAASLLVLIPLFFSHEAYKRNGIWKNEISLWEDVVAKSPQKARGHNNLGFFYASEGNINKAIEHYLIAIKIDPFQAKTYNNLGTIYGNKRMNDMAMECFRTAVKLKPDFAEAHCNLGLTYLNKGLIDEARQEFETALQINPDYDEARRLLANKAY